MNRRLLLFFCVRLVRNASHAPTRFPRTAGSAAAVIACGGRGEDVCLGVDRVRHLPRRTARGGVPPVQPLCVVPGLRRRPHPQPGGGGDHLPNLPNASRGHVAGLHLSEKGRGWEAAWSRARLSLFSLSLSHSLPVSPYLSLTHTVGWGHKHRNRKNKSLVLFSPRPPPPSVGVKQRHALGWP